MPESKLPDFGCRRGARVKTCFNAGSDPVNEFFAEVFYGGFLAGNI
jgi:hypothetical protein